MATSAIARCAGCGTRFELTLDKRDYVGIVFNEGEDDEETLDFCNQTCLDAAVARGTLADGKKFGTLAIGNHELMTR